MVYRMQLTYDKYLDILDIKYLPTKRTSFTLPHGINEINDTNKTLEFLSPENLKVNITIDDVRFGSNLYFNQTLNFFEKLFLNNRRVHSILFISFIEGFIQLFRGSYKSEKPFKVNVIDKTPLK